MHHADQYNFSASSDEMMTMLCVNDLGEEKNEGILMSLMFRDSGKMFEHSKVNHGFYQYGEN